MCLGVGGYEPPKLKAAPEAVEGGLAPNDMVNDQVIDNVNPRDEMEANQKSLDPPKNKTKLKTQSDKNTGLY